MKDRQSEDFRSESWRQALKAYATLLITRLSTNLGSLSGTGISLPVEHRRTLTINPWKHGAHESRDEKTAYRAASQIGGPAPDDLFFVEWCQQAKPLLIVAPFGCGKSVLLAQYTIRLAEQLRKWCEKAAGGVPW